ncbi:MAG: hypothetical protein WBM90_12065, partial [Acidimicrobiia bacterium]
TTQDELINALQEGSVPGGTTQPVVAVAPEESPSDFWLPLATGAAIGLSMAALFMVDRSRRRSESVDGVEGLVPSLDT